MEYLVISFLLAFAKLFVMVRIVGTKNIRKLLYFSKWIDAFFTLVLPLVFVGTWTGMIVAMLSGMWITIFLACLKTVFGSESPFRLTHPPRIIIQHR